ncbi:hypothetical protein Aazo_3071 ['Nostoc azollae' 0708]|jgi:hypothetical protein|uniref:Uncharacterized protein n=1 Tax=Nostoc azollae (strain 0708) TaxID=551115 RepID=D7E1R0_NOSA0|nr:hypothetical protein Aazo_3071 ['Nostoc azollae' 0708]
MLKLSIHILYAYYLEIIHYFCILVLAFGKFPHKTVIYFMSANLPVNTLTTLIKTIKTM